MKAALFYRVEDMIVEDINKPSPGRGEVLVEVSACGICGSDLHIYTEGLREGAEYPTTLGHEIGGTVVDTGPEVDIEIGTDVVLSPHTPCLECWCCKEGLYNLCRDLNATSAQPGGYAEMVVERATNMIPLPDGVSVEDAAIAQPIAVGLHAVRQSPLGIGDSAAIIGAGPIGLGAIRFAKSAGAGPIYVSEPQASRRSVATEFGADVVIDSNKENPVERIFDETGTGVDVAFEAVGHETTFNQAIEMTKANGHTTVIGVFGGQTNMTPQSLVRHQRSVSGSTSHQLGPEVTKEYNVVLRQLKSGELDANQYVTSRISLDDIVEEGFETLLDEENEERKILVCP